MSTLDLESRPGSAENDTVETTTGTADEATSSPPESSTTESANAQTQLPKDVIFDILKNQRRRRVLEYLREHETATLSDLAEHVAALETDQDVQQLSSSERKRVYVGLYQCHLPRMSDAGMIDFERARGTVELRASTEQVYPYLDLDPHRSTTETRRSGSVLDRLRGFVPTGSD